MVRQLTAKTLSIAKMFVRKGKQSIMTPQNIRKRPLATLPTLPTILK